MAAALQQRGHEVSVLTGWPNYPEGSIDADFARCPENYRDFEGVAVIRVPLLARGRGAMRLMLNYLSFALSASVIGAFKLRGRPYDVIFVYEPSPVTVGLPALLLKRLKGAPVVFWVLDLWPESLSAVGAVRSAGILAGVGRMVSFIYRRCDLILAQSRSFIGGIEKYCPQREKIQYFPSWSEDLFSGAAPAPAPEIPRADGVFTILFAGNIGDAQDFPTILAAAERLRARADIRWIIVGDGRMTAWVKQEIAQRGLHAQVQMAGRFPLERMPAFFAHADALLVTLKPNEVFAMTIPGKVQTYLSSGLPIVAALDGEGGAIIREAGAGHACPAGDADGLAAAVAAMAALSAAQRAAMGAAGRAYYAAQFEKNMLIDTLERHFNRLSSKKAVNDHA
ncbi:glycosyltransferase family 4 protein [Janthinobacterium fluminis]|uniref:Glycosyltransferase family 4 protein n=1 Tax=Janthinobacterium fluminis TaxID=2987524 RepID=A0ABT5K1K5_9BURK|nr:glycosyltransferase family 4 protein [Janthinobacterium fluminis]MDC8758867.1 glycosyltransferase family 4 protein [Janthinobacterium fluminis]